LLSEDLLRILEIGLARCPEEWKLLRCRLGDEPAGDVRDDIVLDGFRHSFFLSFAVRFRRRRDLTLGNDNRLQSRFPCAAGLNATRVRSPAYAGRLKWRERRDSNRVLPPTRPLPPGLLA